MRTKNIKRVYRFSLKDICSRYGSIGRMKANQRELNIIEAKDFFQRYGIKLKLIITYNPKFNGKSERGHPPIINALVKGL